MGLFTHPRARTGVLAVAGLVAVSGQAASAAPGGLRVDRDNVYQDGYKCDLRHPYSLLSGGQITLQARAIDPANGTDINHRFVLWPVNQPEARTELNAVNHIPGFVASVDVPQGVLQHGQSYVWRVQVSKGDLTSSWSQWCAFTVDSVNPAVPEVTYPEELFYGVPARFRFSSGGDRDVWGFQYSWTEPGVPGCTIGSIGQLVCAKPGADLYVNRPGGLANADLSPGPGPSTLYVRSIDRAGNISGTRLYVFYVQYTSPVIELVGPAPEWNSDVTLRFTPHPGFATSDVVEYVYTVNGGAQQTVAAGSDDSASITVRMDQEVVQVIVRARNAAGALSSDFGWSASFGPWPSVSSDVYISDGYPHGGVGVSGNFRFSPPMNWPSVASYVYSINGGEPLTVAAGADGRATIAWAPEFAGDNWMDVWAVSPDGEQSEQSGFYYFNVA